MLLSIAVYLLVGLLLGEIYYNNAPKKKSDVYVGLIFLWPIILVTCIVLILRRNSK